MHRKDKTPPDLNFPHMHCSRQGHAWASTGGGGKNRVALSPVEKICRRQEKMLELGQQLDKHQRDLLQRIMKQDVALKQAAAQNSARKRISAYGVSTRVDSTPLRQQKMCRGSRHGRGGFQPWTDHEERRLASAKRECGAHRKRGSCSSAAGRCEREDTRSPGRPPHPLKHFTHGNIPPTKTCFVQAGEEYLRPQILTPPFECKATRPGSAQKERALPIPVTAARPPATWRRGTSLLEGVGQSTNQLYARSLVTLTGRPLNARLNCYLAQSRSRVRRALSVYPKCDHNHSIQMVAAANQSPAVLSAEVRSPGVRSAGVAFTGSQGSPADSSRRLLSACSPRYPTVRLPPMVQVNPCEELCVHAPQEGETWASPGVTSLPRNSPPHPPPAPPPPQRQDCPPLSSRDICGRQHKVDS